MSKRIRPTEDEVNRVLAAKKRHRGKGACYPCNQRKVKCDMNKPCSTCIKRNHPDICIYSSQDSASFDPGRQREDANRQSPSTSENPANAATQDVANNQSSFLGENSAAAYLRHMGGAESPMAKDIVPALGLRNTLGQYPFINAETEDESSRELLKILPTHQEILNYYHFYRAVSFPLSPLIVDIEEFEYYLGDYLESIAGSDPTTKLTFQREDAARVALLLAVLAAGAQYSNCGAPDRRKISRDFAKRSFHALRLANFLLRPLLTSLQALLILGNFLQNDGLGFHRCIDLENQLSLTVVAGNSDAAWAMLGTTMRLAQSLGLHSEDDGADGIAEEERCIRRKLWMMIVQQDCIPSLCYDRPTATAYMPFIPDGDNAGSQSLNYQKSMWQVARVGLSLLAKRASEVNLEDLQRRIRSLQEIQPRTANHLQSKESCRSLQERMQFLLFSLHWSFCLAAICRPTFKSAQRTNQDPELLDVYRIGKMALSDCLKHFLSLHALTVYPTRSWICIHEALSSALLLTILGETRRSRVISNMQKMLIDVFLSDRQDDSNQTGSSTLTSSHLHALKTLQSLAQYTSDEADIEPAALPQNAHQESAPESSFAAQYEPPPATNDNSAFDLWQTDLSPMAFLDSIIWDKSVQETDTTFLGFEFVG